MKRLPEKPFDEPRAEVWPNRDSSGRKRQSGSFLIRGVSLVFKLEDAASLSFCSWHPQKLPPKFPHRSFGREVEANLLYQLKLARQELMKMVMKQQRYLAFVLAMSWLIVGLEGAKPPGRVHLPTGQHQLLLDDYLVGSLYRVERRVNRPVKYEGNPVVVPDKPWEQYPGPDWNPGLTKGTKIRSAPCWDPQEQVWKMWYYSAHRTAFARSKDGIKWEKPSLGKREFEGSKDNNMILVEGDPEAYVQHVLLDPDGTPERRYKGLIGSRDRHPVVSADGYVFTKLEVPVIPSQDESHLNYDEVKQRFIATLKHRGPFGRSVYLSLSKDFEKWTEPELIFHADAYDQLLGEKRVQDHLSNPRLRLMTVNQPEHYNTEIYNMPVFPYEGIYIGLPNFFESSGHSPNRNQEGVNSVKLSTSRDLRRWVKVGDRGSFIPVSEVGGGAIDTGQVLAASRPLVHGDELWFYYTGLNHRFQTDDPYRGAVHLAKLKRDRFAYFASDEKGGFVETRALSFDGVRLFVNANASDGELRVEVVDERGRQILEGWSRDRCRSIQGDHLRAEVKWTGQKDLSSLQGQRVRFRFRLYNARLFSFWIE